MSIRQTYSSGGTIKDRIIAGRTESGTLVIGGSMVQTGTVSVTASATVGGAVMAPVSFSTPMPDNDYIVTWTSNGRDVSIDVTTSTKNVNGFSFRVSTLHSDAAGSTVVINWTAFKLVSKDESDSYLPTLSELDTTSVKAINSAAIYKLYTPLTDFTPVNPVVTISKAQYTKMGNAVTLQIEGSTTLTVTSSGQELCTLPDEVPKPIIDTREPVILTSGVDQVGMAWLYTTGVLRLLPIASTSVTGTPHLTITYITAD